LPSADEARRVFETAWDRGIRFFDTAQNYGVSEERLGDFLRRQPDSRQASVISKMSAPIGREAAMALKLIRQSIELIGAPLWGMLLHQEDELEYWSSRWQGIFRNARSEGLLTYAGISVYTADAALRALDQPELDIVQIPGNVFDRRSLRQGAVHVAVEARKALFVRSIFLQGLIGCTEETLPANAGFAREAVRTLNRFCAERDIRPNAFAVAYACRRWQPAVFLVGVEHPRQLLHNLDYLREASRVPTAWLDEWDGVWPEDRLPLIDPRQWPPRQ
jgi:aryl-alcohol dehydrogenase-like predicted oxidoreductase